MNTLMAILTFIGDHWDAIVALIVAILGFIKTFQWGASRAEALNLVVDKIQAVKAEQVKTAVAAVEPLISPGAQVALQNAVRYARPDKPNPTKWDILLQQLPAILTVWKGKK